MTQEVKEGAQGTAVAQPPAAPAKSAAKKRKANRKRVRRIVALAVTAALLGGGGWALWNFIFKDTDEQGELLSQPAMIGSIQSKIEGSGNARAGDSAAITLGASGTVQEVYVSVGDMVHVGDPLYAIFSPAAEEALTTARSGVDSAQEGVLTAQEAVTAAQEGLTNAEKEAAERRKELQELRNGAAELTTTAPFAGKIISVEKLAVDDPLTAGDRLLTLADDKVMRCSLYFSYAYENSIYVGQSAMVTVPAAMRAFPGQVSAINKVNRIAPEGASLFEVVLELNNPGTLTEGMEAAAALTAGDGSDIFPYENGVLAYRETRTITAKQDGPVSAVHAMQYADVYAGQALVVQGREELDKSIAAKEEEVRAADRAVENAQKQIASAQRGVTQAEQRVTEALTKVEEAEKALADMSAAATIDGTVVSCTISPGAEVRGGETVMTISNTSQMVVEITVDDRNIGFVTPGMMVELSDYSGGMFMGIVTNINMNPTSDNMSSGMTNYPVTLTVDNFDGSLLAGQWLQYSFVASQSDDCVVVPIQSVKSTSDEEGNEISVVFLQAEARPDNAVEMPEQFGDGPKTYPSEEDGFYAVPVTIGLSDTYNVEITSGLEPDDVVFVSYLTAGGSSYGWY